MDHRRVTLVDREESVEIEIDLWVDPDNRISGYLTFFGVWRILTGAGTYPFLLTYAGELDWGHYAGSGKRRFHELKIHGLTLSESSEFRYWSPEEEYEWWFSVRKIESLTNRR